MAGLSASGWFLRRRFGEEETGLELRFDPEELKKQKFTPARFVNIVFCWRPPCKRIISN